MCRPISSGPLRPVLEEFKTMRRIEIMRTVPFVGIQHTVRHEYDVPDQIERGFVGHTALMQRSRESSGEPARRPCSEWSGLRAADHERGRDDWPPELMGGRQAMWARRTGRLRDENKKLRSINDLAFLRLHANVMIYAHCWRALNTAKFLEKELRDE